MPEAETGGIDLRPYIALVRRRAWLIAGVVVATVAAAGLVQLGGSDPPDIGAAPSTDPTGSVGPSDQVGRAIVQVLLQPPPTGSIDADRPLDLIAEAQVVGSRDVLTAASRSLGEPLDVIETGLSVSPGPGLSTLLISFVSADMDPRVVANEVAEAYRSYRAELMRVDLNRVEKLIDRRVSAIREALDQREDAVVRATLTGGLLALEEQRVDLALLRGTRDQVIGEPVASLTTPIPSPSAAVTAPPLTSAPTSPTRTLVAALVIGLALGTGLAFLREHFDERIYDEKEVRSIVPLVLGHMREGETTREEDLRKMIISLEAMLGSDPYVVSVATAADDEPSSDVALGLAEVGAKGGKHVVLSALQTQGSTSPEHPDLTVVAGPDERKSFALRDYEEYVAGMRSNYSFGVVDSGPVTTRAAAASVARFVDLVAIEVTLGATKRARLIQAVRELDLAGATRIGAILRTPS